MRTPARRIAMFVCFECEVAGLRLARHHFMRLTRQNLLWNRRSVYSRLLQCANSRLRSAAAAHMRQLELHAKAALALRPTALRACFELGWVAWSRGDYRAAAVHFRHVVTSAADADDDIFTAAGGWALASAVTMGGTGFLVATAQIDGLVRAAEAAEQRLRVWNMSAAAKAIAGFARQPMRRVLLPADALAIVAAPELRSLPCRKANGAGGPKLCVGCKAAFLHVLKCGRCHQVTYCSTECQEAAWPTHKCKCARSKSR